MSATLVINDLALSKELDRQAMSKIFGRGRVDWEYTGSWEGSLSNYQYTGRYFMSFVQNVYKPGYGWVKKYSTGYEYKREQYKWNYYNEYYT